jgi:hypothetical protein
MSEFNNQPVVPLVDSMLTMPQLKERGWTEAMVRDLLGEPDRRAPNPHYRSAPPMRLWAPDRVTDIEVGEDFAARLKSGKTRSAASVAAADKRREQLLDVVSGITVTVPQLSGDELARTAMRHRNDARAFHHSGAPRDDIEWVNPDAPDAVDSATLDRWKVNYLRHRLTDYERHLEEVAGKVGVRDAKSMIRREVYDAIAERYPSLAAECSRQYDERERVIE